MNRRKKVNQAIKARAKKAHARLSKQHKPKYISKADRAESHVGTDVQNARRLDTGEGLGDGC